MAKQNGVLKIVGKLDDLSFYKSKDGYLVRRKGGVDGSTIASSPNFQRTRENNSEFRRAAQAGKLIRVAFNKALQNVSNPRLASELTKKMMEVVKADLTSTRGERNVIDGEIGLLTGFNFNPKVKLGNVLYFAIASVLDRVAGTLTFNWPVFNPQIDVLFPPGATHVRIGFAASAIDFGTENFSYDGNFSAVYPVNGGSVQAQGLVVTVPANTNLPVLGVVMVEFLQQVNGNLYPLKNGGHNAMQIVLADFPN
jgi:hypothetical protein